MVPILFGIIENGVRGVQEERHEKTLARSINFYHKLKKYFHRTVYPPKSFHRSNFRKKDVLDE